jgi:hypothetical protein
MGIGTCLIITESHDVYQEHVTLFSRITCIFRGFENLGFLCVTEGKGVERECVRELLVIN